MKKILDLIEKCLLKSIVVLFAFLCFVPPLIIHIIYKIPAFCSFFEWTIPAGNMLSYIGTVLTFCATFLLSILVFVQNRQTENRIHLLENRTFISVDEGEKIKIVTPRAGKRKKSDFFLDVKINILSDNIFSKIELKFIEIIDQTMMGNQESLHMDFKKKPEVINFQYHSKENVHISFGISDITDEIIKFLDEKREFMIGIDCDFESDGVVTPITMKLALTKDEAESELIACVYKISEVCVHHHKAK